MELRVAILSIDREDQALEHIERRVRDTRLARPGVRDRDLVAAGGLCLSERPRHDGYQLGHAGGMKREVGNADADRHGQELRSWKLEVARLEAVANALGRGGQIP